MARQRYSRILDAAKLYSAVDNYLKYITDSTKKGQRVGTGTARDKIVSIFVKPYAFELAEGLILRQSAGETTWNAVKALSTVTARTAETAGTDTVLKITNYRAPRIIYSTGRTAQGVAKTSAVTGLKYLSYGGRSRSFPFGKSSSPTDSVVDGFNVIKAQVQTAIAGSIVSLQDEKY